MAGNNSTNIQSTKYNAESGIPKERILGLDLLRIVLAFIIFLFHSRIALKCDYGILNSFVDNGNIVAMTAFFMLSGYSMVISNGYKNYNNLDEVISFYKKRFISIYPLYFVAGYLGVIMYIMMGTQSITDNLLLFPIELLCIQSFFDTLFPFAHNGGSWFISCLVVGYFIFPWINLLLNNLRTKKLIFLLLILVFLLAYSPFIAEHFNTSNLYTNPFFRSMEFVVGMIIARINTSEFTNRLFRFIRSPWAFILSVLFLFLVYLFSANTIYIWIGYLLPLFLSYYLVQVRSNFLHM